MHPSSHSCPRDTRLMDARGYTWAKVDYFETPSNLRWPLGEDSIFSPFVTLTVAEVYSCLFSIGALFLARWPLHPESR